MSKVLSGGLSPNGERILQSYLSRYLPDATIENVKPVGLKGKLKMNIPKAEVTLVIIEAGMYQDAAEAVGDLLSMPKVHKYTSDDGLEEFLRSKFGEAPTGVASPVPPAPRPQPVVEQRPVQPAPKPESVDLFTEQRPAQAVGSPEKDAEIKNLRAKLASSEMMVRSLTQQLNEKSSGVDEDMSALMQRIRELEAQVTEKEELLKNSKTDDYQALGKIAKAEQIIGEVDGLRQELRQAKDAYERVSAEKDDLVEQIEGLKDNLETLRAQSERLDSIKASLSQSEEETDRLNEELEALRSDIASKDAEIGVLQPKAEEAARLREELSSVNKVLSNKEREYAELSEELSEKTSLIASLKEDLENSSSSTSDMKAKFLASDEQVKKLQSDLNSANTELSDYREKLEQAESDISVLKAREVELQNSISELEEKSSTQVGEGQATINELRRELTNVRSDLIEAQENVSVKTKALERMSSEKENLENKLFSCEEDLDSVRGELEKVNENLESVQEQLGVSRKETESALSEKRKLENKVSSLESDLAVARSDDELLKQYEGDLLEERRKNARLSSELEIAKNSSNSGIVSELRTKIRELESQIENNTGVDSAEVSRLRDELKSERERRTELELDVSGLDEQIKEYEENVFVRMANLAMPKVAMDVVTTSLTESYPNFYCIASGNAVSLSRSFRLVSDVCRQQKDRRFLIVDITLDTYIDSSFERVGQIKPPGDWLSGSTGLREFVTSCGLPNVKIISTGLSYLNEFFLISVNWEKRLRELAACNCTVVLLIGNLSGLTTKMLFNTFSPVMKTFVVTESSPVNLRTTMLSLIGFRTVSENVKVICTGFQESSKSLYQRLSGRYKAEILRDKECLRFD